MVVYEKIYLEAYSITSTYVSKIIRNYYILHKGEPNYIGIFPLYLRMALTFTDIPTGSGALLEISCYQKASLSELEKFQRSSALPNIKYNSSILFLRQHWLFIYASKSIFAQTTIVKLSQN